MKKSRQNFVVHANNNVQVTSLASVDVHLLVQDCSLFGNLVIEELKILNFTKQSDKDRVKVYSEEAFGSNVCLLSN